MSMVRTFLVINLIAFVTYSQPASGADRAGSFLTSLLKKPEPPQPLQTSDQQPANPLLAQRSAESPAVNLGSGVNPQQVEAMNRATQAHVQRQLGAIQERLKVAEQRLQLQLARIAKQREAAVRAGDQAALRSMFSTPNP